MKYLRMSDGRFDFIHSDVHEILKTDIELQEKDYEEFFALQSIGKQFKIKDVTTTGIGLFGYVEEFIPEYVERPKSEIDKLKEQLNEMQIAFSELTKLVTSKIED